MSDSLDMLRGCWPTAEPHVVSVDMKIKPGEEFEWHGAYHRDVDHIIGATIEIDGHTIEDLASIAYVYDKDNRPIVLVGLLCDFHTGEVSG